MADDPEHTNLWRDPLALQMLAAFNNVPADKLPNTKDFQQFHNPSTAKAWHRVAEAARAHFALVRKSSEE